MMRPMGFESKNRIGARTTRENMALCSRRALATNNRKNMYARDSVQNNCSQHHVRPRGVAATHARTQARRHDSCVARSVMSRHSKAVP